MNMAKAIESVMFAGQPNPTVTNDFVSTKMPHDDGAVAFRTLNATYDKYTRFRHVFQFNIHNSKFIIAVLNGGTTP